jgi:hypothetical protein
MKEDSRYPTPDDFGTGVVVHVKADWSPTGTNTYEGTVLYVNEDGETLVIEWYNVVKDRWQELELSFAEIVDIEYDLDNQEEAE